MLNIAELKTNDRIRDQFLVAEKNQLTTRDGKPYLKLILMNPTGRIEGTLWENVKEVANTFSQGQIIEIQAIVTLYQQDNRLKLLTISPLPEDQINKDDFLPLSQRDPKEMEKELHATIRKVKNPYLKRLLESIFREPGIWELFSRAPAAKTMHHAYRGGLLEHTLSLVRLIPLVQQNYPFLDQDLLVAGALLHDLGKAWEISPELGFDYTDEGRLLGHILIGLDIIEKKMDTIPDFPPPLAMHVKHLIASHHGTMEFGSPKRPKTLEAFCLHALDDLDAKLWGVHALMKKEGTEGNHWTPYNRMHQRYFYMPTPFPEGAERPATQDGGKEEGPLPVLFDDL